MYNHIAGTLDSKAAAGVVVDAGGVGYALRVPFSTAAALPGVGQRVKLLTYLHVTDDSLTLYGFATEAEREFFLQLMTVNGVGPKLRTATRTSPDFAPCGAGVLPRRSSNSLYAERKMNSR